MFKVISRNGGKLHIQGIEDTYSGSHCGAVTKIRTFRALKTSTNDLREALAEIQENPCKDCVKAAEKALAAGEITAPAKAEVPAEETAADPIDQLGAPMSENFGIRLYHGEGLGDLAEDLRGELEAAGWKVHVRNSTTAEIRPRRR